MSRNPDQGRSSRSRLAAQLFTGLNVAVFIILMLFVAAAAILWDRWH